jgi:hypothetical protein
VPDIGDFADVPVIDLFVKVGDSIERTTMPLPRWNPTRPPWTCPPRPAIKEVLVQLGSRSAKASY